MIRSAPSLAETLVDAAAVYRLTRLIQQDTVSPILELREAVLDRWGDKRWTELLTCPHCLSMWIAAGVVLVRARYPRAWPPVARVLGLAAATSLIAQWQDSRP